MSGSPKSYLHLTALIICSTLWFVTLYDLIGAEVEGISIFQIYALASLNYLVYVIATYLCKDSSRAAIILAGLSVASFVVNQSLLLPLVHPPRPQFGGSLLLGWYWMLQVVFGTAAIYVYAYVSDQSPAYRPKTFPNRKILAAAILGLPAIAFLTLVYF
jgi:hypothetical protein